MFINASEEIKLGGDFSVCHVDQVKTLLDIGSLCTNNHEAQSFPLQSYQDSAWLLGRDDFVVDGKGFECLIKFTVKTHREGFFGTKSINIKEQGYLNISKFQCNEMVSLKQCYGQPMRCSEDGTCGGKQTEVPEFKWLESLDKIYHECGFFERIIQTKSLHEPVIAYAGSSDKCLAEDLFCYLPSSIVIWDQSLLSRCQLHKITKLSNVSSMRQAIVSDGKF